MFTVLDVLTENVNLWTKLLPLDATIESWEFHSPNAVVAKRCNQFKKEQMRRGRIDAEVKEELESDNKNYADERETMPWKIKRTVILSHQMERSRLFELTVEVMVHEGIDRKFRLSYWMNKIDTLRTILTKETTKTRTIIIKVMCTMIWKRSLIKH